MVRLSSSQYRVRIDTLLKTKNVSKRVKKRLKSLKRSNKLRTKSKRFISRTFSYHARKERGFVRYWWKTSYKIKNSQNNIYMEGYVVGKAGKTSQFESAVDEFIKEAEIQQMIENLGDYVEIGIEENSNKQCGSTHFQTDKERLKKLGNVWEKIMNRIEWC